MYGSTSGEGPLPLPPRRDRRRKKRPKGPAGSPRRSGWIVPLLAVIIGGFMAILDTSIVNVAIPTIMHDFGVDTLRVEWVVTAYILALGVVVPASGWLGDSLGLRRVYVASLAVFTLGSALAGLAPNLPAMIAARIVQAIGGGLIGPTTMAMVFRMVPRERIGVASGLFGVTLLFAPAVGPTLGGYLVQYVNWRWIFTINIPIGILGIILALAVLPEFRTERQSRFDGWGFATSAIGLFALLFALSEGPRYGWTSEWIVILFYTAAVALGLFVWIELTVPEPLIDLRMLKSPPFALSLLVLVVTSVALFTAVFYVPLFLQTVRGKGALETGLILMPGALASGFMMPIAGRLYDRFGPRIAVLPGIILMSWGTYLFRHLGLDTPDGTIVRWLVIRGLGMGLVMMPATTAGMVAVRQELVSRASAMNNIVQRVSGSFGIAIFTSLLQRWQATAAMRVAEHLTPRSPAALWLAQQGRLGQLALYGYIQRQAFVAGVERLFVVMALLGSLALLPAFWLRGRPAASAEPAALRAVAD